MNKYITKRIDDFIRENKTLYNGNYWCESQQLSENELKNFVNSLMFFDDCFKEVVRDYLQELIDVRINIVQAEDNLDKGLIPRVDPINGEISYSMRGGV